MQLDINGFPAKLGLEWFSLHVFSNKISTNERFRSLDFFMSKYFTKFIINISLPFSFSSGAINSGALYNVKSRVPKY